MSTTPGDGADDVGSVGEEAVKLFGALSDWARDHGGDLGQGLSGLASQAADSAREVADHVDAGDPECRWCPVCRTVHAVRQAGPEVREHLAVAAASLMQAAAGVLAAATREPGQGPGGRSREGVERIDLDPHDSQTGWPEDDQ